MNALERGVRAIDRFQQRHLVPAFVVAVQKKAGDDNSGTLIANLAYAGFVTVFPLLLIMVTVLGIVVGGSARLTQEIENSAIRQFPVIGTQLAENIHALHRSSAIGLTIGLIGTVWGATGLSQTAMFAMSEVWNVPGVIRPNFVSRLWRSFAFLGVIALSVVVAGTLSSFGLVGGHGLVGIPAEIASAAVNVGAYLLAYRVLTAPVVRTRQMVAGAIVGGVVWTVIEAAGGYFVTRSLRNASAVYGTFALVLGLLAWIYLAARVAVYAAEINAVLAYRLWPRGLAQPPLTEADRRALTLQVTENSRRPEQQITVTYLDSRQQTPAEIHAPPSPAAPYAVFRRRRGERAHPQSEPAPSGAAPESSGAAPVTVAPGVGEESAALEQADLVGVEPRAHERRALETRAPAPVLPEESTEGPSGGPDR